jgi:hypothetical protein
MRTERKPTYRLTTLNMGEECTGRDQLTVLAISASSPLTASHGFGYYYFAEVWPALLRAGSG